jgi:hypothetical protein
MTLLTVTLTDSTGTITANLNSGGPQGVSCGLEFQGNNPLILIPVPADSSSSTTSGGAESINLKMLTDNIIVTFSLFDTFGSFNMTAPSTTFEKLRYMFKYDSGTKTLVVGSTTIYVVISNLDIPIDMEQSFGADGYFAGVRGTMTLTVVNQN